MASAAGEATGDKPLSAELCAAAGRALKNAGDLSAGRPWYERALAIRERVLGLDHPDTARTRGNLANLAR